MQPSTQWQRAESFLPIVVVIAVLLACAGGGEVEPETAAHAAQEAAYASAASSSEGCWDRCSGGYDGCSDGCLNTQLGSSLANFGDASAVSAAGQDAQSCLEACSSAQQACQRDCELFEEQERLAREEERRQAMEIEHPAMAHASDDPSLGVAAAEASASCGACPNSCGILQASCASGSQVSCYQTAACLCQCHLVNGGCGSSFVGLQQCIADNNASANALLTQMGGVAIDPAMPPPEPSGPAAPEPSNTCPNGQKPVCGRCSSAGAASGPGACAAW
jgi:hypothetical protein